MMTNCLFYAVRLYVRRKARGKRCYLAIRKSDLGWTPHFLVFELRFGHYRVISYKPHDARFTNCPPLVFEGAPRWGDHRQRPSNQPNPTTEGDRHV
jgi:hypothetical protein